MNNFCEKLTIEFYNCSSNKGEKHCGLKRLVKISGLEDYSSENKIGCNESLVLENMITNHIKKRGCEDLVEIKKNHVKSTKQINCFAIIANKVIKDFQIDEVMKVVNDELDRILYNSLKNASRDFLIQQYS